MSFRSHNIGLGRIRLCALLLVVIFGANFTAWADKKNPLEVITTRDVPLQVKHTLLKKPQKQCSHDILLGHLCWRVAAVSTEALDGSTRSIALVVENEELQNAGLHEFNYAPLVFAVDGKVTTTPSLDWTDYSKMSGSRDSIVTLQNETLLRQIAAASEVYVTIIIPDRMSVKLSADMLSGIRAVLTAYDANDSTLSTRGEAQNELQSINSQLASLDAWSTSFGQEMTDASKQCPHGADTNFQCEAKLATMRVTWIGNLNQAITLLDRKLALLSSRPLSASLIAEKNDATSTRAKLVAALEEIGEAPNGSPTASSKN